MGMLDNTGDNYCDSSENINLEVPEGIPLWLKNAIKEKNPLVPLALANSILLPYDGLDFKLLAKIHLN
jgi:hypothetical protein